MSHESARIRAEALESLLVEKGLIESEFVDDVIARYNDRVGPLNGARVVARAWRDPAFKQRLLNDGTDAIAEYDFEGGEVQKLVVVENTDAVHNVVVCTLCSCYPRPILGQSPEWYRTPNYRRRLVRWPRQVLSEFGLQLPEDVEIRVADSNQKTRYVVMPVRPEGTDGWGEDQLAEIVTRDCLIGVAQPRADRKADDKRPIIRAVHAYGH